MKSQVVEKFDEYRRLVQNQSGHTIKAIRTDNGGEYTSNDFQQICKEYGIVHQFTTPYTPQQNGVCERKNRTIMEMARCLLFESKMPRRFWAEGVNTSVYLQNRMFTKALDKKTPFELWHGSKPSLDHIKVFGSVCYLLVPQETRRKLDEKAKLGVLVGYSEVTKGFRVFNLETRKLMVTRDIKVDEEARWDWTKEELQASEDVSRPNEEDCDFEELGESEDDDDEDLGERSLETTIGADIDVGDGVRGMRPLTEIYERANVALGDPTSVIEAYERKEWREAMQVEIDMINKNQTWSLVTKPKKKHVIGVKWIFRTKYNPDGSISKHKAR